MIILAPKEKAAEVIDTISRLGYQKVEVEDYQNDKTYDKLTPKKGE